MKVTLYIDGEHNTVEVKDKIKSVLPDANYMIFHPAESKGKVTEFDRIKNMSVQEMAEYHYQLSYQQANSVTKKLGLTEIKLSENERKELIDNWIQWLETEVETE
jgi:hypothetical protein